MPFVLSFCVSSIRLQWADQPENLRAGITAGVLRSARSPEGLLQELCYDEVHRLVAANVVPPSDSQVAVSEELGCQLQSPNFVDRGRRYAPKR